jgi:hypothetical protein
METTLYKITFTDGRIFKVFCANKAQKERWFTSMANTDHLEIESIEQVENGIHNIKQWEDIISLEK